MGRRLLRALVSVAYVGLLFVVFGLSSYVAFNLFVRSGVTPVPDLQGLGEDEARSRLIDQGLEARHSPENDRFDAGLESQYRQFAAVIHVFMSDVSSERFTDCFRENFGIFRAVSFVGQALKDRE